MAFIEDLKENILLNLPTKEGQMAYATDTQEIIMWNSLTDSVSITKIDNEIPDDGAPGQALIKGVGLDNTYEWRDSESLLTTENSEIILEQLGDVYGASRLILRNRDDENGAIFDTIGSDHDLTDFIFRTNIDQRNIRYESRPSYGKILSPEFSFGIPDSPSLVIADTGVGITNKLAIGTYDLGLDDIALNIIGDAVISGNISTASLNVSGDAVLESNLNVIGDLTVNNEINANVINKEQLDTGVLGEAYEYDGSDGFWQGWHIAGGIITEAEVNKFPRMSMWWEASTPSDPTDLAFYFSPRNIGAVKADMVIETSNNGNIRLEPAGDGEVNISSPLSCSASVTAGTVTADTVTADTINVANDSVFSGNVTAGTLNYTKSINLVADFDVNLIEESGFYEVYVTNATTANLPDTGWWYIQDQRHSNDNGYRWQIARPFSNGESIFHRSESNNIWGEWYEIVDSRNLDSLSSDSISATEPSTFIINDDTPDVAATALTLDCNMSGDDTMTGIRNHIGLRVDIDSTVTSGTTTNDHRVYGLWNSCDVTGDSDLIYPLYNTGRLSMSTDDTITTVYNFYNYLQTDNSNGVITT
ncbi:MAG: hypothetical protein KAI79_06875, partial [Bacteroidales bacterium]|nr:hypothetical protein [Bacteroidales bacterium]